LANNLNDAGRKLLALDSIESLAGKDGKDTDRGTTLDTSAENEETTGSINIQVCWGDI